MKFKEIDNGNSFDFGKTSEFYAKYRDIYPNILFEKMYNLGIGKKETKWLDIGTGTGVFPRAMAHFGADIIGIDISEEQINQAKLMSKQYSNINYCVTPAENTVFEDNSFDEITACQCFWYFNPEKIVPEIKRIIKKNGVFVKVFMDWAPDDEICSKSQKIVKSINTNWTSGELSLKDMKTHYFDNPVCEEFDVMLPFTRKSWHGRMLASRGVMGSMNKNQIAEFEKLHKTMLKDYPEKFKVKHNIYIVSYNIGK